MTFTPACDKGCEAHWNAYWGGRIVEAQGLIAAMDAELRRVTAELEATRRAYNVMEEVARNWEDFYRRTDTSEQEYKALFYRSIGLHDDRFRNE